MNKTTKYNVNDKYFSFTLISPIKQQSEEVRAFFPGKVKGWYMQCECGSYRVYEASHIVSGRITSCGCKRGANISAKRDHNKGNEKRKQTFLARHGVENAGQLGDASEIQKLAWKENKEEILAKRRATGTLFSSDRFKQARQESGLTYKLADTGESLQAWYDRVQPLGSYQTYCREAREIELLTEERLLKTEQRIKDNKSSLEAKTERLLGLELLNRRVHPNVPYRFDFKVKEDVYLNVDGLYWHCEDKVDKEYHSKMRQSAEQSNIRLIQIRQDEIEFKAEIIKSIISHVKGATTKSVSARKCQIKDVSNKEAKEFYARTHLMGHCDAKHLGLFLEEVLVSLISFKSKGMGIDITRFSSELDTSVRGGLSRLLSAVESINPNVKFIEYWVDLRYGSGKGLETLGFTKAKDQVGGFCWTDYYNTFNRLRCTTKEKAEELKWKKIYDAGQRCYVKYK